MKRDERGTARRIGLQPKTLANWRGLGMGPPYYKLGYRVVYDDAEVDAWLATKRRTRTRDRGGPAGQTQAAAP